MASLFWAGRPRGTGKAELKQISDRIANARWDGKPRKFAGLAVYVPAITEREEKYDFDGRRGFKLSP
jgi:hypothetical protein